MSGRKEEQMYSFDSRVRYSETGPQGRITPVAILDYFQDCSSFQSEELGIGVAYLKEHHLAWVLVSWQIEIARYPALGEVITAATWPYDFKGFYGYRNFAMTDSAGVRTACGNSSWVLLDTETGRPVRLPQIMVDRYVMEPALPMEQGPRKMKLPEGMEAREPFVVQRFHLDTNQHVNNGKYILMAQEYLPEGFGIGRIRAEYKKSAVYGDTIYPSVKAEEQRVTVSLADESQAVYTIIELEKMHD